MRAEDEVGFREQQHDMLFELAQRCVLQRRTDRVSTSRLTGSSGDTCIIRFVEDRTFKLLVIDSVMNLFRKFSIRQAGIRSVADESYPGDMQVPISVEEVRGITGRGIAFDPNILSFAISQVN